MRVSTERKRLIILDRDGVINQDSAEYIKTVQEWIPIPGSLEAIARLNQGNYRVLIASNQSGLGRGFFRIDSLNAIHAKMQRDLARLRAHVDAIFFCPHAPGEGCSCRKPKPGLLQDIAMRLQSEIRGVPFVGDSLKDLQAAAAAGASPLLVLTGNGRETLSNLTRSFLNIPVYKDLSEAADALLKSDGRRQ